MGELYNLEEFEADENMSFPGEGTKFALGSNARNASESIRVTFYEQGYQAGWDDAAQAAAEEQGRFSAEFSHNLQDLGFTFQEARSQVIHSLEPLLLALVEQLFPKLMQQTLAQRILEEIAPLVDNAADTPIQIVVSEANREVLEPVLANVTPCPLDLTVEESLGNGQVFLRAGNLEKHIDLDAALQAISQTIKALDQGELGGHLHG